MELNKIEKTKKPAMVVFISTVVSVIVLIVGILGMSTLASFKLPHSRKTTGNVLYELKLYRLNKRMFHYL